MPNEDYDNWKYFLKHFRDSGLGSNIQFIMSVSNKELTAAVQEFFPTIPHGKCLRHLSESFNKKFGLSHTGTLKSMAKAYTVQEYDKYRSTLGRASKRLEMLAWIDEAEPQSWCRAHFPVARFGVTTSNSIETVFNTFNKAKHLPTVELLLWIEGYVLANRFDNLALVHKAQENGTSTLSPKITKDLETESKRATVLSVRQTGDWTGMIYHGVEDVQEYSVDVVNRTCTCGRFQEQKYPCCHAVKLIAGPLALHPNNFCSEYHSLQKMKQMHGIEGDEYYSLATTKGMLVDFAHQNDIVLEDILPPKQEVKRGRKRKNNIQSQSKSSGSGRSSNQASGECTV